MAKKEWLTEHNQVMLPKSVHKKITRDVAKTGKPRSEVIREVLVAHYAQPVK